jgi:twitching motility protein PilT
MAPDQEQGRNGRVLDLDQLLAYAVQRGASDVHLKVGSPPYIRIDGRLERIEHASVSQVETERIAFAIMPKQRAEEFIATSDADFAYSVSGVGRFRVNAMRQRGSVGLVLRRVQSDIPSFEELGLPPVVRKLA